MIKYCMHCSDLGCTKMNVEYPGSWSDEKLKSELEHEMPWGSVDVVCKAYHEDKHVDIMIDENGLTLKGDAGV